MKKLNSKSDQRSKSAPKLAQKLTENPSESQTVRELARSNGLLEAVLSLKSIEEAQRFFTDLCTPAELDAMADRWWVAQLLDQNIPYREIYLQSGVSTATVTRVARCLTYGEGYRILLERLKNKRGIL